MSKQARWAILILVGALAIAALMIVLRPEPEEQERSRTVPLVQTVGYEVTTGPDRDTGLRHGAAARGSDAWAPKLPASWSTSIRRSRKAAACARGGAVPRSILPTYNNRVRSAQADIAAQDVAVLQAQEEVAIAEAELERFAQRQSTREALQPLHRRRMIMPPASCRPKDCGRQRRNAPAASPR